MNEQNLSWQKNNLIYSLLKTKIRYGIFPNVIDNQLSRRNLSDYSRTKLALKKEEFFAKKAKENQVKSGELYGKGLQISAEPILESIDTRAEVAKLAGVSHDTVAKVKIIEAKATEAEKQALATGEKGTSINKVYKNIKEAEKVAAKIQVIEEKATEEAKAALTDKLFMVKNEAKSPATLEDIKRQATTLADMTTHCNYWTMAQIMLVVSA